MYPYIVGQPYSPNRTKWPEQCEYNYRSNAHELRLFFPDLRAEELAAIRHGSAKFALTVQSDVIFFLHRFGNLQWADAIYNIHMVPEAERTLPPIDEKNALLHIFLINGDTGILEAIRLMSLGEEFTRKLDESIRAQAAMPFDQRKYDIHYLTLQHMKSSRELVDIAIARCNVPAIHNVRSEGATISSKPKPCVQCGRITMITQYVMESGRMIARDACVACGYMSDGREMQP